MFLTFDSFKPSHQEICSLNPSSFTPSSFINYEIDCRYSKELEYLKEIKEYKEGWDSYDGKTADENSLSSSINLLSHFTKELKNLNILTSFPELCLAPDGIVGFEWDYAQDANLFARIHSLNEIEYSLTENNKKKPLREIVDSEIFIEMCKEKLTTTKAA